MTTKAMIGLSTQRSIQEIEQPSATLDLQQPQAKMSIQTAKSQLSIDTTEARADMDLMSSSRRTAEVAHYAQSTLLNGLERRAQEGRELMMIENGGNPLSEIAKRAYKQPYSGLSVNFIPSHGSVNVSFEPGQVDIQVEPQQVINNSKANKPIHTYTPGKVTTEMLQNPSIQIDWRV
nr:DUF6470 family protein [Sporosarcina luteola]